MDPGHEQIEKEHAHIIASLLAKPSPQEIQKYYSKLMDSNTYCGLRVQYINPEIGKGVFSTKTFQEEELVLKEHLLVGGQHTRNKGQALVCSSCFCFIGSIETQIATHLLSLSQMECDDISMATNSHTLEIGQRKEVNEEQSTSGQQDLDSDNVNTSPNTKNLNHVSLSVIESLMNGCLRLPYSDRFSLPPTVECLGGCKEECFCSETCARTAWESHHKLLCTGAGSLCRNRDALLEFKHHADETNDIFHVAAKVIASTILEAQKVDTKVGQLHKDRQHHINKSLLKAWEPFSMGCKCLWWESVALPADICSNDEVGFREEIKQLCSVSLALLKNAIFQEDYAPLFSLQVYGNIIGMFELNNLDLVVVSPVEDYFVFIDDLPTSEKIEAMKVTRPLLDALGDEYDTPCQGTAFFPVQSCINHSCCPNIKAFKRDEDTDGQAVLVAMRPIRKGEEITLSYIDEDSTWEERKAMLADYCFMCKCDKCSRERNTQSLLHS